VEVADIYHVHPDFGNDAGFLAGVQRIINGLFDRCEQGFARIIEG
jgi:hypothetical protein